MAAIKLTKAAIDRVEAPDPSGKQRLLWDAELRGFGMLISGTTTAKTYIVQRRLPDGRTRRVTIGNVAEFERVEDARRKAGPILQGLRDGKDPKAEQRRARASTLKGALDAYLATRKNLRARSIENYRLAIERHFSAWLDKPLRQITDDMVEAEHARIGETVGPAAANHAMRTLRAVYNLAADRDGTLPPNPVRRLKRAWFAVKPRERLVMADDLPRFFAAVEALPSRVARDYLLLLLFTGLRRREAAAMQWSEIDFAARVIRLPAIRAKSGQKLDLPMSDFVRDLLVARRALGDDGPWVFAANSRSGHIEEPKFPLAEIAKSTAIAAAKAAGVALPEKGKVPAEIIDRYGVVISAHDLRRTFVTAAEDSDISPLALKALVNHSLGSGVTENYVRITIDRLREPAQRVTDKLKALCGITAPEGATKIGERA